MSSYAPIPPPIPSIPLPSIHPSIITPSANPSPPPHSFVGLTPSILITLGLTRWLTSTFGNRRYARSGTQKGRLLRTLRHIDRLLTAATPSATGMLSYREHGLLLVEIHELRTLAGRAMPGPVLREFLEELDDLAELRTGVERQLLVVKRVRWGFARYIS